MKATKITVGILMILISLIILFQSMAAGLVNSVENNGHTSGSAGVFMAIAYLVSGIIYLVTQKMKSISGDIASAVVLILLGLVSLASVDNTFTDLKIWILLGFIIGLGFLLWHIYKNKHQAKAFNQKQNYNSMSQKPNQNPFNSQMNYQQYNQSSNQFDSQQSNNQSQQFNQYRQNNTQRSMTRTELRKRRNNK